MVIELKTGEMLVVESRGGKLTEKVFSWPLGLFSGVIAVFVALLVLLAVRRETRPLRQLSAAALRFAQTGEQQLVPMQGAPEIRRLVKDFNSMQGRIGELLSARALMLGALGHDLRTYLTRIQLRISAMGEVQDRAPLDRDLAQMSRLIDDSLAWARLGIEGPREATTDVTRLLIEMTDDYAATGANIIFARASNESVLVSVSESMLRRLFANLIDNALKYGTACQIRQKASKAEVTFTIEDNGPGVAEADLINLRRPFFRANEARTLKSDGHGLGLAIAHEVVTQHGGSLVLDNVRGGFVCSVSLQRT